MSKIMFVFVYQRNDNHIPLHLKETKDEKFNINNRNHYKSVHTYF